MSEPKMHKEQTEPSPILVLVIGWVIGCALLVALVLPFLMNR